MSIYIHYHNSNFYKYSKKWNISNKTNKTQNGNYTQMQNRDYKNYTKSILVKFLIVILNIYINNEEKKK